MSKWYKPWTWGKQYAEGRTNTQASPPSITGIPPGRVSEPDFDNLGSFYLLRGQAKMVKASFRLDLIPLIRDLYKINPDVGMALQDMFKLANTGHYVQFPNNTDDEEIAMIAHLKKVTKKWSKYVAGIDGLVNKFITQCLIGGAISIEGVPNKDLNGIATVLFLKPEKVKFKREANGVYHPYQKNPTPIGGNLKKQYIRLNTETYMYAGMYNDTDEPYGVPPFMSALDSLNTQHTMKNNMMNIMEKMGLYGFMQALIDKPERAANESDQAYANRLQQYLVTFKRNLLDGMSDGLVTGYIDDHTFDLKSTTQNLSNVEKPWEMNERQVANGLGVNPTIIGANGDTNTEGGSGILLSKMISQLKVIQMMVSYTLEFLYSLELRLAGFNNKGMKVKFYPSTIADEVKIQQAEEYKVRNTRAKYDNGWISQTDAAREMGYDTPDQLEPRVSNATDTGTGDVDDSAKKKTREGDKDRSDRKVRDKVNPAPKRGDQDTKPR